MSKRETVERRIERGLVEMGERVGHLVRLKGVDAKRRITQKEVAEAVGVSEATISDLLKGKKATGKDVILRLADYFGTTPEYLEYGVVEGETIVRATMRPAQPVARSHGPAKKRKSSGADGA